MRKDVIVTGRTTVIVTGRTTVIVNRRRTVFVGRISDVALGRQDTCSCSTLTIETLGETGEHLNDSIIAGAQFLICFVGDVFQIFSEK